MNTDSVQTRWLLPGRVLLARFTGHLTLDISHEFDVFMQHELDTTSHEAV